MYLNNCLLFHDIPVLNLVLSLHYYAINFLKQHSNLKLCIASN